MIEELADKPLDSARETIASVAGGGDEPRGVQLVLGVGALLVISCVKKVRQEIRELR
jgi:hypothetical protein